MNDLRQWRDDPAAMVEWLMGVPWEPLRFGQVILKSSSADRGFIRHAQVCRDGWRLNRPEERMGPETGTDGIRAASLAILASRPVWEMPTGGSLILGRYPTAGECIRHPSQEREALWVVCYSEAAPSCIRTSVELAEAEAMGCDAPLYCIPLLPDGRHGSLRE